MVEDCHSKENSGIPIERMKNTSLKEMLRRMDYWQKEQEAKNERMMREIMWLRA